MLMSLQVIFKFIAKNPSMALIAAGILVLLLSPVYSEFKDIWWKLIAAGIGLNILWLILWKKPVL